MKTTTIIGLLSLTLMYASAETNGHDKALLDHKHNLQTSTNIENMPVNMSNMKAMDKCGAGEKAHKHEMQTDTNISEGMLGHEHRLDIKTSEEESPKDMKVMGKCGAGEKAHKHGMQTDTNTSKGMLGHEHRFHTKTSEEKSPKDMKAMGKCGTD